MSTLLETPRGTPHTEASAPRWLAELVAVRWRPSADLAAVAGSWVLVVAALFLGDTVLGSIYAKKLDSAWWRALSLLLAIVAIAFVRHVPVVGPLAWGLLFLAGIGAFTLRAWDGFRSGPATA